MEAFCRPVAAEWASFEGLGSKLLKPEVGARKQLCTVLQAPLPSKALECPPWKLLLSPKSRICSRHLSRNVLGTHASSRGFFGSRAQNRVRQQPLQLPRGFVSCRGSVRCSHLGRGTKRQEEYESATRCGKEGDWKQDLWPVIAHAAGKALLVFLAVGTMYTMIGVAPAQAADLVAARTAAVGRLRDSVHRSWPWVIKCGAELKEHGVMLASLLAASAFFSLAETSITTLWPWKVRELAEKEKEEGLGDTFRLLQKDVTRFLTTILIGSTIANIAATALVTESVTSLFGEAGIGAATAVMTVVVLLLTEIAPKSIAVHNAAAVANMVVRPVHWLSTILYPVGRVCTWLSVGLLKLLGLKSSGETLVSEEEMKLMLSGAMMSGTIEPGEQDMIEAVLEMDDTTVKEVMTALVDVEAIESKATLMELRDLWLQHQYSRIPVYEKRIDKIVGIAYAMDMLDYVDEPGLLRQLTVERIVHKNPYFVPDVMSVWNLLREFRIRKVHMAIVVNEYGGTTGIVTLEDVVEEIVGEIYDENDSKEEIRKRAGYIIGRDSDIYDIDANTSIDHLEEELQVEIPEGQFETVSGWVCGAFGYIPRSGESVTVTLQKSRREHRETREEEHQKEQGQEHHHRGEEEENEDEDRSKWLLRVTMANARKVQTVRLERASEDQPLTGPADEKLSLKTKRLRGWDTDYDPPERKGAKERGGFREVDPDKRVDAQQDEEAYTSDEEAGEREFEGSLRNGEEEAGSSDEQFSDSDEQYVEAEDGFLDGPVVRYEEPEQDEESGSESRGEGENGGTSIRNVLESASNSADVKSLQAIWEAKAKVVERRQARRRQEAALAAAELARIERFKGEGITLAAGRSKNNKRTKRRLIEPE